MLRILDATVLDALIVSPWVFLPMDIFSFLQLFVHSFFRRAIFSSTLNCVLRFFVCIFFLCHIKRLTIFFVHAIILLRNYSSTAGRISISSIFQHDLQDGFLSLMEITHLRHFFRKHCE